MGNAPQKVLALGPSYLPTALPFLKYALAVPGVVLFPRPPTEQCPLIAPRAAGCPDHTDTQRASHSTALPRPLCQLCLPRPTSLMQSSHNPNHTGILLRRLKNHRVSYMLESAKIRAFSSCCHYHENISFLMFFS